MGRRLAVGDIHGMHAALQQLLAWVAPTLDDHLVFLGDYVDRGPHSKDVLDTLVRLHDDDDVRCSFLLGNHERMMLDARHDPRMRHLWLRVGGAEALASYGVHHIDDVESGRWIDVVPDAHWRFLDDTCQLFVDDGDVFFVHAGLAPDVDLAEHDETEFIWRKHHGGPLHPCGKRVVCGHTEQRNMLPLVDEGTIIADTFAYGGGPLTCVSVDEQLALQQFADGRRRQLRWSSTWDVQEVPSPT